MDAKRPARWAAWVNGESYTGQADQSFIVQEPATGADLAEVVQLRPEDVAHVVGVSRQTFDDGRWADMSAKARGKILWKLAQNIREQADDIAQWETRQVGKPIRDARDEVLTAADCFEFYAGAATKIYGHTIPVSATGLDYTLKVPIGVVGVIVPWNFPFLITAWKVAPALAAGNSVIVKPASYTPLTALLLGPLARDAGVPDGVLNIVTGPGREVGESLVTDPRVDKIAFTGETTTGSRILALSAPQIKRVSLELGGKSPTIVFAGVDIDEVAKLTVQSAYANSGQDCCARGRILVQSSIAEEFTARLVRHAQNLKIGDPLDPDVEMGPLVSSSHRQRILDFIQSGVVDGAQLVLDEKSMATPSQGFFLAPTVFAQAPSQSRIVQEEIFGPVTTIQTFETEDEAVSMANSTVYGLSGSVFCRDVAVALRVAGRVRSGVMSVNSITSVHLEAPFGGFKHSGLGRELGTEALDLYTEIKNVFVSLE